MTAAARPAIGKVSTQATTMLTGDRPPDRRQTLGRADAHDRRGDDLRGRDRCLVDEGGDVEDRRGRRLGGEAARRVEVDDAPAERAHDPPATGVGAERDRRSRPRRSPSMGSGSPAVRVASGDAGRGR